MFKHDSASHGFELYTFQEGITAWYHFYVVRLSMCNVHCVLQTWIPVKCNVHNFFYLYFLLLKVLEIKNSSEKVNVILDNKFSPNEQTIQ